MTKRGTETTDLIPCRRQRDGRSGCVVVCAKLRSKAYECSQETAAPRSRGEAIALRKEAFSHDVVPVEEAVTKVGGEVVGHAWINQTVRARVPAHGLEQLSELDEVAVLDVPHTLQAEVG